MKSKAKDTCGGKFVAIVIALVVIAFIANGAVTTAWLTVRKIPLLLAHVLVAAVPVKAYVDQYNVEGDFSDRDFFDRCWLYCTVTAVCVFMAGMLCGFLAPKFAKVLKTDVFYAMMTLSFASVIVKVITDRLKRKKEA